MRIGMICPYSLTIPGGVQAQVLGLARELRHRGHAVRILAPCDGPPPDPCVTPLGSSVPFAANGSVAPLALDWPSAVRTVRALKAENFDVVHVHEPLAPGPSVITLLNGPAPVVATFHRAGASRTYALLGPVLARLLRTRIDRWIAVSRDAAATAAALGGDFLILFNGVDVERFANATRLETTPGRQAVFFLGRHEERKGLSVLLEAFSAMPDSVDLWVAGTGPQTEELQRQWADDSRISWLGRVSDAEAASRVKSADAFCIPSLHGESFGIVLLEGMAAGTPVVASDIPGYRNVGTPELDAIMPPPGDPVALRAALNRVLSEPLLAERLRGAGRRRAGAFSMTELAGRYETLYRQLVEARERPSRRS